MKQCKRNSIIWVAALLLTYLCCCSSMASAFTAQEFLSDYDQFWQILETSYPFFPALQDQGRNIEAIRQDNRALIGTRVKDIHGFYSLLRSTTFQLNHLAHLSVIRPESLSNYQALAEQYQMPEKHLFHDPQTIETYRALGHQAHEDDYAASLSFEKVYYADIHTLYLRFPSFAAYCDETGSNPVAETIAAYPDAEHIIFDITGNGGGNTDCWQKLIVSAFASAAKDQYLCFVRLSPYTAPYYAEFSLHPVSSLPAEKQPAFVQRFSFTHYANVTAIYPDKDYTGPRVASSAKRWLLIDERVYSAADMFAFFCKNTGWATLVGKPTRGDGACIRAPLPFRLSNTGLLFRFSGESAANADGTPNAVFGTMPDIPSIRSAPLETCLQRIRAQYSGR